MHQNGFAGVHIRLEFRTAEIFIQNQFGDLQIIYASNEFAALPPWKQTKSLTRTKSKQSPVIFRLFCPMFTVYLYSPSDASFVDKLCNKTALPPVTPLARDLCCVGTAYDGWAICWPPADGNRIEFRLALGRTSSELDEVRELHEPAPTTPCPPSSIRTGDALRRIVSSINCFAQLQRKTTNKRMKRLRLSRVNRNKTTLT